MKIIRVWGLAALSLAAFCATADGTDAVAEAKKDPVALSADVRAKIGEAAEKPETLAAVMNGLDAEGQKAFLAAVNAAIAEAPGSDEQRAALFLNANRKAIQCGIAKKNMVDLLAVTFATVPPYALTVISERFAEELFNRAADAKVTFKDAAYEKIAAEALARVEAATAGSDDAAVRDTLAILMFVRASNGTPADLADTLCETIADKDVREMAKKEWIPAALAAGEKKSYDAMLAYAGSSKAPEIKAVMVFAGPQILSALLVDLTTDLIDKNGKLATPILDEAFGGFDEQRVLKLDDSTGVADKSSVSTARPLTQDPTKPWNPQYSRNNATEKAAEASQAAEKPTPTPEPKPYPYGDLGN